MYYFIVSCKLLKINVLFIGEIYVFFYVIDSHIFMYIYIYICHLIYNYILYI